MGVCIGLDAHAKTCVYVAKDDRNVVVGRGTIPSLAVDLAGLADQFPGATVVIESSGVTEWIYDLLTAKGMQVYPVHPQHIRKVLGKKNDEVDAEFLCDAYRLGCLRKSYVPKKDIRELRQLARRCTFLTKERTRFKNRAHGALKRRGARFLDEETEDDIADVFAKKNRGRLEAVGDPEIPVLLELIDAVTEKRKEADDQVREVADWNRDVMNLMTIPGFGPLVAVAVYAEIGEVERFRSAKSVACYFGLVPIENQSGETRVRGHITRAGQSYIRWLLGQAAWVHVSKAPLSSLTKAYKRVAKRAGKKRAITGVARELAMVAYNVLKEKRSFTMNRPTTGEPRTSLA